MSSEYLKYKKKYLMLKGRGSISINIDPSLNDITNCVGTNEVIPCPVPINRIVYNTDNIKEWKVERILNERGLNGLIYIGYLEGHNDDLKIIKHIKLNNISADNAKKQIYNEICLQNIASSLNIAPQIYDYIICDTDNTAVIVMEKVGNLTLDSYFKNICENLDNPEISNENKIIDIINLYVAYKLVITKLMILIQNNIVHCDFHLNNIMVKTNSTGQVENVFFIDFGLSQTLQNISSKANIDISENIQENKFSDNAILFNHYYTLTHKDLFVFYYNEDNGINEKINKYKEKHFCIKLKELATDMSNNVFTINSIYYYYALQIIKKEILDTYIYNLYSTNNLEIWDKIIAFFDYDLDLFVPMITDKIKDELCYISSFFQNSQYNMDNIEQIFTDNEELFMHKPVSIKKTIGLKRIKDRLV